MIWPTIPADILGQSGTAWQIFPNFQIGQGLTSAVLLRGPTRAMTRTSASSRSPSRALSERRRAADGVAVHPKESPNWLSVLPQDFSNMAAVQQGMKSLGFPGTKPNLPRTQHRQPSHPAVQVHGHRRTTEQEIDDDCSKPAGPLRRPDDIDIDALRRSTAGAQAVASEGATQYLELKDDFAEFARSIRTPR